ncbi:MAG: hypothetical protein JW959_14905 [Pirellulales bacterium]|nr:hypothetical protein [Pirellulales bacterium]
MSKHMLIMGAIIFLVGPARVRAEEPDFKADFLRFCDANAKIVEQQIDLPAPPPKPFRGFFPDSYTVRALAVACDLTGDAKYLDTCKRWSDRMIRDQNGMLEKGAYYMNYGRAPGEDKGHWYVADCSSIALGVLATAVRCGDPAEKAKYLDSVKAFYRLVADKWVRPSGGLANGHWPKSDDEFWCATGIFGSLAFCLYKETGDEECLKIGRGTIDWLNRQNLMTVARDFYPEETIKPTVIMYCLESYSAGLPHLEPGSRRREAALIQLDKARRWILDHMRLSNRDDYLTHWGSKHGGLPFHLYVFAEQVPGNSALAAAADGELAHIGEIIKDAPADPRFDPAQLTDFALMSYAEKVAPGGIYRSSTSR